LATFATLPIEKPKLLDPPSTSVLGPTVNVAAEPGAARLVGKVPNTLTVTELDVVPVTVPANAYS
jgi:hypothetical protein